MTKVKETVLAHMSRELLRPSKEHLDSRFESFGCCEFTHDKKGPRPLTDQDMSNELRPRANSSLSGYSIQFPGQRTGSEGRLPTIGDAPDTFPSI
jgi:hypothetical protein